MRSRKPKTDNSSDTLELRAGPWDTDAVSRTRLDNGIEVRLPGAIPGELHRVRIIHRSRGGPVHRAQSLELLDSGPGSAELRRSPPCPLHGKCGACGIQHVRDDEQLRLKVESALALLPESLRAVTMLSMVHSRTGPSFGYRHKAVFLPAIENGHLLLGGFRRGSHEVIDLPDCSVLCPALVQTRTQLQQALHSVLAGDPLRVAPPGNSAGQGASVAALRSIIARANRQGEVLLCAVVTDLSARLWLEQALTALVEQSGPVVGVSLQVFNHDGDAVAGSSPELLLSGRDCIHEQIGMARLQIRPLAFFQVNPFALSSLSSLLNKRLLSLPQRPLRVLDLYCGGGALGMALAAQAPQQVLLTGLDIDPRAISSARRDAKENEIDAQFEAGPAAALLPGLLAQRGPFDVVIVDPPRRGLRPEAAGEILSIGAKTLLYVSCHSPSLARDAQLLQAGGYKAVGLWPVDMLPQTPHLEWVAAFVHEPSDG